MKPCIIIFLPRFSAYEAYSENGRLIVRRPRWGDINLICYNYRFSPVPLNSRCGRTILDKVNNHHV